MLFKQQLNLKKLCFRLNGKAVATKMFYQILNNVLFYKHPIVLFFENQYLLILPHYNVILCFFHVVLKVTKLKYKKRLKKYGLIFDVSLNL